MVLGDSGEEFDRLVAFIDRQKLAELGAVQHPGKLVDQVRAHYGADASGTDRSDELAGRSARCDDRGHEHTGIEHDPQRLGHLAVRRALAGVAFSAVRAELFVRQRGDVLVRDVAVALVDAVDQPVGAQVAAQRRFDDAESVVPSAAARRCTSAYRSSLIVSVVTSPRIPGRGA